MWNKSNTTAKCELPTLSWISCYSADASGVTGIGSTTRMQ